SASAAFTAVKITQDGLIVRGEIGSGPRQAPVVQFNEIDEGRAFSALATWIPGGKIDRYIWSWVGHSGKGPAKLFSGSHKSSIETHRFSFSKPAGMDPLCSVSLRIEGTQTGADGLSVPIAAESPPQLRDAFGTIVESPAWWEPIMTPVWLEETKPDAKLKDLIARVMSPCKATGPAAANSPTTHWSIFRTGARMNARNRGARHGRDAAPQRLARPHRGAARRRARRPPQRPRSQAARRVQPVRGALHGHRGRRRRMVARLRGRRATFGAPRECAAPVRMELFGRYRTRGDGGGARQTHSCRAGTTNPCAAAQGFRLRLPRRP